MSDFESWLEKNKHLTRSYSGEVDEDDQALARAAYEAGAREALSVLRGLVEAVNVVGPESMEQKEAQEQAVHEALAKALAYLRKKDA